MLSTPDVIGVVGDVHGNIAFALKAVRELARRGISDIHFLGDFGLVWTGTPREEDALDMLEAALDETGTRALVTGGNHDGYDQWEQIAPDGDGIRWVRRYIGLLPRGWRAQTDGGTVLASLGGANSIDRPYRERVGAGWWPQEQITDADLAALGDEPVDVLLAHDAPMSQRLTHRLIPGEHRWELAGLTYAKAGQAMFHRGFQQVRPKLVLSGHYHFFIDTTEEFDAGDGAMFTSRSVVLNMEGKYPSLAAIQLSTGDVEFIQFDQSPPRGWLAYDSTPG